MSDLEREREDDLFSSWIYEVYGSGVNMSPRQTNTGIICENQYEHPRVQMAWEAWQARAKLDQGNIAELIKAYKDAMIYGIGFVKLTAVRPETVIIQPVVAEEKS